jgi:ABC-type maltose transport system permease subunit
MRTTPTTARRINKPAAIVVTLPVLLLTIVIQKQIVVGLTAGGVKGG